jgi:hypothetical protein
MSCKTAQNYVLAIAATFILAAIQNSSTGQE